MVEGAEGAPVAPLGEAKKKMSSPSSKRVVEEGILGGPGREAPLGNVFIVAKGFPGWLAVLDPQRCSSVSCCCPPVFKNAWE